MVDDVITARVPADAGWGVNQRWRMILMKSEDEEEEERCGVKEDRTSLSQVDTPQVTRRSDGVALWAQLLVSLRENEREGVSHVKDQTSFSVRQVNNPVTSVQQKLISPKQPKSVNTPRCPGIIHSPYRTWCHHVLVRMCTCVLTGPLLSH